MSVFVHAGGRGVKSGKIREQMCGPDLYVFTLKFLALKNGVSTFSGSKSNFSVRTL
jgi:hypothetical protein